MKILIAPNSMKGSLSAFDFADIVENALLGFSSEFEVRKVPVADGGDFTGEILGKALKAERVNLMVQGPLGQEVSSGYFISGKTAIIEMADASGMKLIDKRQLNPMKTSTYGTGELINDAILKECSLILLAVGGSATVDGGTGMLNALGFSLIDSIGRKLYGTGEETSEIADILMPFRIPELTVKIISDVNNPLLGRNGAATVFGPQKGASPEMVVQLENGLKNWAELLKGKSGKSVSEIPGTGAAGGISVPLLSFYNAEIVAGAEFILTNLNFDEHLEWADLVITGEGKIDTQTMNNKAPFIVAQWAKKRCKPVIAIGGSAENQEQGIFDMIYSISDESMELEYAMKNAGQLLYKKMTEIADQLVILKKSDNMECEKLNEVIKLLDDEKATEALNLFKEIQPVNSVKYFMTKGKLEQKFQKWGTAMNAFNRVLELDPENVEAKNHLLIIRNIVNFWNPEMFNP